MRARQPSRTQARFVPVLLVWALLFCPVSAWAQGDAPPDDGVLRDTDNRFSLEVGKEWSVAPAPAGSQGLHFYKSGRGLAASVTRFDAANRSAFRKDKREAFFSSIERGLANGTRKFKRHKRKHQKVERTPILDLEFSRLNAEGVAELVWMRMLFRYRFTVVLTVSAPASAPRRIRRQARAFVQGLRPQAAR